MIRDTSNYRRSRKVSRRGITNDPTRRERGDQQARQGGRLTVDSRDRTTTETRRVENR